MGENPTQPKKRTKSSAVARERLRQAADLGVDAARRVPDAPLGNLDVPLSVWPVGTERSAVVAAVVTSFSTPGDLVAVTLTNGGARVAAAGRRAVIMCHRHDTDAVEAELADVEATRRALAHIRIVTNENLSPRLVGLSGKLDLLIAPDSVRWCEGFFNAAAHALRPGGHLALISATADSAVHAGLNDATTSAGLGYAQHIIASTPEALDDAVTLATMPPRRNRGHSHSRAHVDVFVYTRPGGELGTMGVGHDR